MCGAEWPAGKTLLRDTALALFAARGPDAVSVRDVAAAAGVSPGLVVHHFGTKQALRQAVDDHVTAVFQALLDQMPSVLDLDDGVEPDAAMAAGFAGAPARARATRVADPRLPAPTAGLR